MRPSEPTLMLLAAGALGRLGIVMRSPQTAPMKPAPPKAAVRATGSCGPKARLWRWRRSRSCIASWRRKLADDRSLPFRNLSQALEI